MATAVSTSQINLSWNDVASETGYELERAPNAGGPWGTLATLGANSMGYSSIGLSPSTQYCYRVKAVNATGPSGYSGIACATTHTAAAPPATPTGLVALAVSTSQLDLSWNDVATTETSYDLERAPNAAGPWGTLATLAANSMGYSSIGLSPSTQRREPLLVSVPDLFRA